MLHLAQKRNLGAGWGEFKVHWTTAIKEVKGGRRKADFESPEIDAYHYYNMSDDDDEAGGKECAPAGTNTDGTVCWNCKQLNNQKNEKCSRCGENLDVDNFYY